MNEELPTPSIKAGCPDCGDVVLVPGDIRVVVQERPRGGAYVFRCPDCRLAVSQPAENPVVELLILSGSALVLCTFPAEADEACDGPPLSPDDLIDFHFELQHDDWFRRLCSVSGRGGEQKR